MRQDWKNIWRLGIGQGGTAKKQETAKYIRLAVLFCFVAGIVGANVAGKSQTGGFGLWNTYFIEKFKYMRIRPGELFCYVLEERLPVFLLLLLLSVTNWGFWAAGIFLSWQGFAAGFLLAASVVSYGAKGLLLMGAAFFPQYLLYLPLYVGAFSLARFFRDTPGGKGAGAGKGRRRQYLVFFGLCTAALGVYVTGIFLESYVNPYLLKKILKIF